MAFIIQVVPLTVLAGMLECGTQRLQVFLLSSSGHQYIITDAFHSGQPLIGLIQMPLEHVLGTVDIERHT